MPARNVSECGMKKPPTDPKYCYDKLETEFKDHMKVIGWVALVIAVYEVSGRRHGQLGQMSLCVQPNRVCGL